MKTSAHEQQGKEWSCWCYRHNKELKILQPLCVYTQPSLSFFQCGCKTFSFQVLVDNQLDAEEQHEVCWCYRHLVYKVKKHSWDIPKGKQLYSLIKEHSPEALIAAWETAAWFPHTLSFLIGWDRWIRDRLTILDTIRLKLARPGYQPQTILQGKYLLIKTFSQIILKMAVVWKQISCF